MIRTKTHTRMEWASAWQLAGEIVDLLWEDGTDVTIRQQEEMASLIYQRSGQTFSDHTQEWVSLDPKLNSN